MISIALFEPQIPPNTGNISRLCVGLDIPLMLVGKMGFGGGLNLLIDLLQPLQKQFAFLHQSFKGCHRNLPFMSEQTNRLAQLRSALGCCIYFC